MPRRKQGPIFAALVLAVTLTFGLLPPPRTARAQGGPPVGTLAVVDGRQVVFVRSGPSTFYPIAGYLTPGSLIVVDGRSSRGTDAWLRSRLNGQEVWVPHWRLTVLGSLRALPIMFRTHTPPQPIRVPVETMRGEGSLQLRRDAQGSLTVHLRNGQARSTMIAAGGLYRVEVYFLNSGWGVQTIEVSIDGRTVSHTMVQKGTAADFGTIVGYESGPFILPRGLHLLEVRVVDGSVWGTEIDEITLRPVAHRFPSNRPVG